MSLGTDLPLAIQTLSRHNALRNARPGPALSWPHLFSALCFAVAEGLDPSMFGVEVFDDRALLAQRRLGDWYRPRFARVDIELVVAP